MTITFVPGEVNNSPYSVSQALWRNHHIIVYGSGNNLIITSTTRKPNTSITTNHLQTVYLDADPIAIEINPRNALIVIAIRSRIILFQPVNEYMVKPQWTQALEFINFDQSEINCLQWAPSENEIVIGSDKSLTLYHIYNEYNVLKSKKRWYSIQSNPITNVKITNNSNKIVTFSGYFDRLVKVWSRINYGDDNTLFELSYLSHPENSYVTDCKWRYTTFNDSTTKLDASMANIKNIRGYIDNGSGENDTLYTVTNDNILRVWASYDISGHSHIRCWASLDLNQCFYEDKVVSVVIIDNYYLHKSLVPRLKSSREHTDLINYLNTKNLDEIDILLVISRGGKAAIYSILNVFMDPPSSIKFDRLDKICVYFDKNSFPSSILPKKYPSLTKQLISSTEFQINLKPIILPEISYTTDDDKFSKLSIIIHDRLKNTIRFNSFDFKSLLNMNTNVLGTTLLNKFQGQAKSIRKLFKSNSPRFDENILLSISNFPEYNYIWEPLILDPTNKGISVTKRFQLNVKSNEPGEQGIWNAVLVNDITLPKNNKRHHLVAIIEKNGYISLWDCNGTTRDDQPAELIERSSILDKQENQLVEEPKAFVLTNFPNNSKEKCIVAIFENDLIRAWRLSTYNKPKLTTLKIENLPQNEKIHQIANIDSFVSEIEKNLISVIDHKGKLRIFAIDFRFPTLEWIETFSIHTDIDNASKIHGSTIINKFAIVDKSGYKLTIWDTKSGVLEYEETFQEASGPVKDLDWTFINSSIEKSTSNAVLSVGFSRFVLLYTQLRYDYTNKIPSFAVLKKIDISDYTSHEIGDSISLNDGYLIIGCGNQLFIDDRWIKLGSNTSIDSTIRQLMIGYTHNGEKDNDDGAGYRNVKSTDDIIYDVSHLVRTLNGPLPIYHPQFLIQCLFMNQFQLVKDVLVRLFQLLREGKVIEWDLSMNLANEFMESELTSRQSGYSTPSISNKVDLIHSALTNSLNDKVIDIFNTFSLDLSDLLVQKLSKISLPLLTRHQQITLISIISIVKDLDKYLVSLDENGIRFFIGFKLFQMSSKQTKLTMRDINWALHSDNKEMILTMVEEYYKNRLKWENVKQTGLVYWVETSRLIKIIESCARNEFGESRDPSGRISLFYLAIHKKQVLIGLWRTISHPEQQKMLKFLNNNFTEKRWKSAALKNAFVLLGKHRYIDAAYFFLLADAIKDCCSTLANKVNDVSLAIAIAKAYQWGSINNEQNEGISTVIENYIIPEVIQNGDKWTTCWIFWEMNLKEISIQALIKSPIVIIKANKDKFSELCNKNHINNVTVKSSSKIYLRDDPLLAILFSNLRQKTLKYLKGSLSINSLEEFDFIIKVCLIYTRMGCDYLSILLIRNWKFIKFDEAKNKIEWINDKRDYDVFNNKESTIAATATPTIKEIPSILSSFDQQNNITNTIKHQPPPSIAFDEPDMSSFSFGF